MPVSLNQYRGEIGSFYNRSTSQITDMTISLSNILLNFTKNILVYIILLVNLFFSTLLDQFLVKFNLCYMEILNRIQDQGLIPVKASQFATGISIA